MRSIRHRLAATCCLKLSHWVGAFFDVAKSANLRNEFIAFYCFPWNEPPPQKTVGLGAPERLLSQKLL